MARRRRQNASFPLRRRAVGPRIATTSVRSPMPKSRSSNGRRTKARRRNTGSQPWWRIQPSRRSWKLPNCACGSRATIRNSSKNWASITMKIEAGEAFHHHMALCVAAYGFLVSERSSIPRSDDKTLVSKTSRLSNSQSYSRSSEQDSAKAKWTAAGVRPLQFRARRKIHTAAARGDGVK